MVCFLTSLMSMIVSTRFHSNTIFLRGRGRRKAGRRGGGEGGDSAPRPEELQKTWAL